MPESGIRHFAIFSFVILADVSRSCEIFNLIILIDRRPSEGGLIKSFDFVEVMALCALGT